MTRPKTTTPTIATPEPGILAKSGLDITLENIEKRLTAIDDKLDTAPTLAHYETVKQELDKVRDAQVEAEKQHAAELKALDDKYAGKHRFEMVEKVVYGAVAFTLIAVLGAVLALVIMKP